MEKKSAIFNSVIDKHKGIIYQVANSYCRNEEDRKDLMQEIIIHLWQSFDRYDNLYKYSTWIYRIALNVAISFYRKESRRKRIADPLSENLIISAPDGEHEETETNLHLLKQFISELKELDRALMILYLEEKSHKEMAEILGLSETNIATKIGRIKKKLKQKFFTVNKEMAWKNKN